MEHDVTTATKTKPGDGPLLLETRAKHGLSQEEMGILLGLTQSAITHLEKGRNRRCASAGGEASTASGAHHHVYTVQTTGGRAIGLPADRANQRGGTGGNAAI